MVDDFEIKRAPALRISNIVRGRELVGNRVHYFVNPDGSGEERGIPEEVVLRRWRKREHAKYSFHGFRLGPNIWRAVIKGFGTDAQVVRNTPLQIIAEKRMHLLAQDESKYWKLPPPKNLSYVLSSLSILQLQKILNRHAHPQHIGKFGTPDLFVFAKRKASQSNASFFRFVEVKRQGETVSADQKSEIAFLQSIGVASRVFRLTER